MPREKVQTSLGRINKVVVEDATPPETLAATADRYVEIMAAARERQRALLIERGILPTDGEA